MELTDSSLQYQVSNDIANAIVEIERQKALIFDEQFHQLIDQAILALINAQVRAEEFNHDED